MFYTFKNKEKRSLNNSFVEIQYCKLKQNNEIDDIVSLKMIRYNKEDSLFIHSDDIEKFYLDYKEIFNNGIYNNLKQGTIDLFGINYFGLKQIDQIISKIEKVKPLDYEVFLKWLKDAKNYNGFYILGI